ncbi:MAG TPA: CBS domain-containing protein [Anaerolineae bacterium]|nr:CBS domain-containing protein [Anaerolineae bacterium]
MDVILTHEQADFDGISAMLGAYLLQEHAVAILPRQLNRNVQDFLKLYNTELPFMKANELPKEKIDSVTLVDTQSLVTLKGMHDNTNVFVLDHHQKRDDFPNNWVFTYIPTGASTTYFIEDIREQNGNLTMIQATLLLLGIYEDTGSLIYPNTTSRDAQAVAYLLSQGASLIIASEYLNPPLSDQQEQVLERTLENIQTHTIKGQKIIIAFTEALGLSEEVSSIAHKICNLFDPNALFLFVQTKGGIRFVARSNSKQINVAEIAALYNGGGHTRAAAALIRKDKIKQNSIIELIDKFISRLPAYIKPAVTVGQIMSENPLLISPATSAEEALQIMRKFGYEGYPVVDTGKVVGLLTRRAVDRAISHKLNLSASSLMEAGDISVTPQESLEALREIMASSDWGQIPVINSKNKRVIGIVTRTDLIKTNAGSERGYAGKLNLSTDLESALSPTKLRLIKLIATHADDKNLPIFVVGGFVRDLLMHAPSPDFDFVVEGNAINFAHSLAKKFGGRVTSHTKFGTAKWGINEIRKSLVCSQSDKSKLKWRDLPTTIDFISARTEFYSHPTALPTIKRSSIKLDLHRRDFTINTMALRLDGGHYGELFDYWGGLNDLKQGVIRVLHSLSFVDDPTRMLRAVRFEQRFNFDIEARTLQLLMEAKPLLQQVSGDRIRHEIDQIFIENKAVEIFERLQELGLLSVIHVDIRWKDEFAEPLKVALFSKFNPKWKILKKVGKIPTRRFLGYLILLTMIPQDSLNNISKRLKMPRVLKTSLQQANTLYYSLPSILKEKPSALVRRLAKINLAVIYALKLLLPSKEIRNILDQYAKEWRWKKASIDGNTLNEMNITPGPIYQKILDSLRDAWINGEISSKNEEKNLLRELIVKHIKK